MQGSNLTEQLGLELVGLLLDMGLCQFGAVGKSVFLEEDDIPPLNADQVLGGQRLHRLCRLAQWVRLNQVQPKQPMRRLDLGHFCVLIKQLDHVV